MILSSHSDQYTIPGKNVKVTASLELIRKGLGGEDSATTTVAAGNKPKQLSVALTLPYADVTDMQALTQKAESLDSAGDPIVYDIAATTALALNIRQVIFTGSVKISEQDSLQAWSVSFALQEVRSIAEKTEERLATNTVSAVTADGQTIAPTGTTAMDKLLEISKKL